MDEELTNMELTKEDMKELSAEELADLKIELEDLIIDCEEILEDEDND